MSQIKDRLQEARRLAGYANATDAARAFGWNENTYRSHENGERGLKPHVVERYAKALRVSFWWLMTGENTAASGRDHRPHFFYDNDGLHGLDKKRFGVDFVLPIPVPLDAQSIFVITKALLPRYGEGDIILCWQSKSFDAFIEEKTGRYLDALFVSEQTVIFGSASTSDIYGRIDRYGADPVRDFPSKIILPVQIVLRQGSYEGLRHQISSLTT